MNETFEDRLLAALESEVAENATRPAGGLRHRSRRARIGVFAGVGALAVAGVIAVPVMFGSQTESAAWAVETRPDGSVKLELHEFKDPEGLERRLAEAGIPAYITFVPPGMVCANRTIRSDFSVPGKGIEPQGDGDWLIHPGRLGPDERLVLTSYAHETAEFGATYINLVPMNEERCEIRPLHVPPPDGAATPTPTADR